MVFYELLEDGKGMAVEGFEDDAPIKGNRLDEEDVATKRVSSDTEEIRLDEGSNTIMARLQFCDYHNMVVILEKGEHNIDFHPMVDFVEASPLRELEEELEREAQRINAQIARDEEIAKIHAEEELQQMIAGLDRSNEINDK
nr:hypothetical protein [Tanacetum cinerariifolium]